MIDSHQHFWAYDPARLPWIDQGMNVLRKDFLGEDYQQTFSPLGVTGSVAVQACQDEAETRWLLEMCDQNEGILGVVGWTDFLANDVADHISQLAAHPALKGFRHIVQDEPDDNFLDREDFRRGVGELMSHGLTYDILVYPRQLPAAIRFARALPEIPLVLDHLAKPQVKLRDTTQWKRDLQELAHIPHVCCKLSGLVTEAEWHRWKPDHLRPYLEHALETFGPDRVMVGTDWPVCLLAATPQQVLDLVMSACETLNSEERMAVLTGNAARFYDLDDQARDSHDHQQEHPTHGS